MAFFVWFTPFISSIFLLFILFINTTKGQTLLSGNVYCACCGCRIVSRSYSHNYTKVSGAVSVYKAVRYYCYHRSRKLNDCTNSTNFSSETIDTIVVDTIHETFSKIADKPETEAVERKISVHLQTVRSEKKKLLIELEKYNKQLEKLQMEIADSLTGDSIYSAEDLSHASRP